MRMFCIVPLLLFAIAALLPIGVAAQSFTARLYGQDDGLDNQAVVQLAQDAAGHLWIGTENGLFRYDGSRFLRFGRDQGLSEPRTYNIHIDQLGTLWVATPAGLFYFDGARFREVQIRGREIRSGMNAKIASTSRGEVLVSTANGLLSIERDPASAEWGALPYAERHPSFHLDAAVHGVIVDRHDRLWFGCGRSICSFSPPSRETPGMPPQPITLLAGVPEGSYDGLLEQQNAQQNGRLWARSAKFILTWLPGDGKVTEASAQLPGFQDASYVNLIEDRLGNVLTPTTDGFATWDGSRWEETANTTAGTIDGATALLADREGGLWIGTPGKGLLQALGYKHWTNYTLAQGLNSQVIFGIAVDQRQRVWLGTPRGVDVLPPGASRPIASPLAKEPDARWIEHLVPTPDGGMWAAALQGQLYHIDKNDRVDKRAFLPNYTKGVRLDPQGTLWVASISGLFHLDCPAGKNVCTPVKADGVFAGAGLPEAMQFDQQGDLWVATRAGLFVVRKGVAERVPIHGSGGSFEQGLTEIAIALDGTIWLAGHFPGLIHVRVDLRTDLRADAHGAAGDTATILDSHSSPELASDLVEFLESDAKGRIWAGNDHGVNVLYNHRTVLINMQDGLIWNDTDWNAFLAESDGSVWIGTSGGASHLLDPAAVLERAPFQAEIYPPQYGVLNPGEQTLKPGSTTPWGRGTFVFGFTGLTFRDNRSLIYHYRMEGLDSLNIETHSNFARFQELPPGTYNFVVVAEDRGHNTFSAPASVSFTLSPPWWRTRLFFTLEGIAAVALLLLVWRWSNLALLAQRKRLQRLVTERTVELQKLAVTDALTGLLNRGAIMNHLATEAAAARERHLPLCVAIVDLDHFKRINDTLGHAAGDEVLREAARRLASAVRTSDFVGRYGGEEFLVIVRDIQKEFGRERSEALRKAVCASPIVFEGHELSVTASVGVAWSHGDIEVEDALVALADRALYAAKEKGRNCVELASAETETVLG
jgi:diguanylate cyclase (GGDEF)-like protein